jgi:hypothetical protein
MDFETPNEIAVEGVPTTAEDGKVVITELSKLTSSDNW